MQNNLFCKCNTCNSLFEYSLLESPCPFCNDTLNYKEQSGIINYFKIPKLNNPKDFMTPSSYYLQKLPFSKRTSENYLVRNNKTKYSTLKLIPVYKFVNNRDILINLYIIWENDFKNKSYGIFPNPNDSLSYILQPASLNNLTLESNNKNIYVKMFEKIVPYESYERFLRYYEEFKNSFNISVLFSLYNSINWNLLDVDENKKNFYEFGAVNYLIHIFELIKIAGIKSIFYDECLLSFIQLLNELNINQDDAQLIPFNEFKNKYLEYNENLYLESLDLNDFEDVFDYFSVYKEGAVAPNAVGLNQAATNSASVFTKLYQLGYKPEMQVYSVKEKTSLCPTFEKNNSLYYIECNNNIMKGINKFDSLEEMYYVLNEVYNKDDDDSMFVTIEGLTDSIMMSILSTSNNNKDFLTKLIDLNNKRREDFIYANTVQDEYEFQNSILSEFDIVEMTPQSLFKYGNTNYKLRNIQRLGGNQQGYMFIDRNGIVVGYIIVEDKVYNIPIGNRTIKTVTSLESASMYKDKGIEIAMIDYYKKKNNVNHLRIECRNFMLIDKIDLTNEYKRIDNPNGTFTLFESIQPDNKSFFLNEALTPSKRKLIEEKVYKVFDLLDRTGANTQKYKNLFKSMSNEKFDKYIKDMIKDKNKNFYLEILPNKNCPRIKDCKAALDYLKVPTEEYLYYRHDGHKDNPLRTRYPVPILYVDIRRVQQMLSKKNTYSLDISKRNMKTGQVTSDDKIA